MDTNMITDMLYVKSICPHYHENLLEIIVVLKGTITIHKLDRTEIVSEGQFVMVNKNITHWIESKGAYILVTKIKLDRFKHIYDKIEYVEFYYLKESVDRDLRERLNAIIIDCVVKNFVYQVFRIDQMDSFLNDNQLMSTLYSFYRLNSFRKIDDEYVSNELLDIYYYVVEFVNKHVHEKVIVDDILKHVYMNSTYFSQFMKKIGGLGFKEFVSYVKFSKVVQYLIGEELTMTEIAAKVGMTDMKSFYNSFKRYFRISPSKWRKSISYMKNDYIQCFDDQIFKTFLHEYNIVNHHINTITRAYKRLLKYQMDKMNLKGTNMKIEPFADMRDYNQKHYQVYKNFSLLIRKADELGVKIEFIVPVRFLKRNGQENLLRCLLLENTRIYSPQDLKKWSISLLVNGKEELNKAKKIQKSLYEISKNFIINIDINY